MSASAPEVLQRHRLTVRDYHRMAEAGILGEGERVELIEGEIIDMAPIGSHHAGAVMLVGNRIKLAVGESAIVSAQNPLILDDFSEIEPDVVLLTPRPDFCACAHPRPDDVLLVIEVVAIYLIVIGVMGLLRA